LRTVGQHWERCAEAYLSRQGLQSIARNFATRHGEIDLIMLDDHHIAFVEVRYRSASRFGDARLSVTAAKQRRVRRCAQSFLQTHPAWQSYPCRFDVIAYDAHRDVHEPLWLRAAFDTTTGMS
tara:strand:+ start:433 stop:801 length:369 start_codon:yes stop_codon:yes gene_type:complete